MSVYLRAAMRLHVIVLKTLLVQYVLQLRVGVLWSRFLQVWLTQYLNIQNR